MFFCMSLPAVPAGASQSSKAIKKVRNGHFLKLSYRVSDKTLPEPVMNYSFEECSADFIKQTFPKIDQLENDKMMIGQ